MTQVIAVYGITMSLHYYGFNNYYNYLINEYLFSYI